MKPAWARACLDLPNFAADRRGCSCGRESFAVVALSDPSEVYVVRAHDAGVDADGKGPAQPYLILDHKYKVAVSLPSLTNRQLKPMAHG
jgi:hypothetical protein